MHDDIKRFWLNGEISDKNLTEGKERMILFLHSSMRDKGFAPVLDIDPQFTLNYKPEKESFDFELSVYGTHIGREKACTASGVINGKILPMPTRPRT